MANTDAPRGLRVLKNPFGTTPQVKIYQTTSAVIYRGQLVRLRSDGTVEGADASIVVDTDVQYLGTAAYYKAANAATSEMHVIIDKGDIQYVCQMGAVGTIDTPTEYIGLNFKTLNAEAGSTTTGDSSMEMNGTLAGFAAATDSSQACIMRCVDIYSGVDNRVVSGDATESANADFIVQLNPQFLHFANSVGI